MNAELNKKAWNIRRNSAKRFGCKIMEISWRECLKLAKQGSKEFLDSIVKKHTTFDSFEDFLENGSNCKPLLCKPILFINNQNLEILANAYDYYMQAFGLSSRIRRFRGASL